jgi:predicted exporter
MPVPRRNCKWIWSGRITATLVLAGLVGYLAWVGLDTADKLASCISVVIAVAALLVPYLLPTLSSGDSIPEPDRVEDSGVATATVGGQANTGVQTPIDAGPAQVTRSGDAHADGADSSANTGIQRR